MVNFFLEKFFKGGKIVCFWGGIFLFSEVLSRVTNFRKKVRDVEVDMWGDFLYFVRNVERKIKIIFKKRNKIRRRER